MKIAFGSDLHFEFGTERLSLDTIIGVDCLVLAGDINKGRGGPYYEPLFLQYAASCANQLNIPVICVAGNHELYGEEYHSFIRSCRRFSETNKLVYFLENDTLELSGVRFLGCTLWSDFQLGNNENAAKRAAFNSINDYKLIGIKDERDDEHCLVPRNTIGFNKTSRQFLEKELSKSLNCSTVVVTHFPPIFMSASQYSGEILSAYFCNDWQTELEQGLLSPDLWITGHTHHSTELTVGKTRLVSKQGGYPGELEVFDWGIVEV